MQLPISKTAKRIGAFVGFSMALALAVGGAVAPASAATIEELQAQVAQLLSQINALTSQLNSGSTSGSSTGTGYVFTTDLEFGATGEAVMQLQKVLNSSADTQVSSTGAGSPGQESTYFGSKTKAAVMKFQSKKGISPVAGYVGPKTRAALNAMSGSVTTPGTGTTPSPSTGTGLTITSATQPMASLAPESASRVPFTKVMLTASTDGDITVNGLTVERTGLAQDAVFSGLVLLDENGLQIGIAKTLNSNHQVTVGEPFVIKAGTTKTVTVAGNMSSSLDSYAGQVVSLSVVGVSTSATVSGALPIVGASHTINASLAMGTAQLYTSSFDPDSAQTKNIGETGLRFAGVRVTAGSAEAVRLWSIRFNQTGSAGSNDLANVKVYVDGTAYDTTVSSDGKYYTALFGSGIVLDKGLSKDVYIQGDLVGSSSSQRTAQFDLYKNTDIYLTGETYHYGIIPTVGESTGSASTASEFTTGTPFFSGSTFTISAGTVTTIGKSNTVSAANIAVNVPNQVLGGFDADIKGEPISVQTTVFTISTSTASLGGLITNVSIYDENGAIVAGPVDAVASTTGTQQALTFTDTITFQLGKHTYTIKGKIPSGATNGAVVTVNTAPATGWSIITGQTTGNTISFSGVSAFNMNAQTVKGAALTISVGSTPSSQTVVAGTSNRLFSSLSLNATQSGEDVRFSSIPLKYTFTGAAANLNNCKLYDGSVNINTGSNVVNPTAALVSTGTTGGNVTFTFDQSLTVAKGTTKTLTMECNISSTATSSSAYSWGLTNGTAMTVTGVTSGADVSESLTTATGPTMTIGSSGSLAISAISASTYKVAAANTTGVEIAKFNFRATNEAVKLEKVGFTLQGGSPADFVNGVATLWDGSTQLGTVDFSGLTADNSDEATTSLFSLQVPKDGDKVLTLKADLSPIGPSSPGTPGRLIKVQYDSAQGKGAESGATVEGSGSTSFAGVRTQRSYPVITVTAAGSSITDNYTGNLVKVTVAASSAGDIVLNQLSFGISSSTAIVDRFEFIGPTANVSATTSMLAGGATTTLRTWFDSTTNTDDRHIPAGTSKDFYIKGVSVNLTGGTDTNKGTLSFTLKGDTAYPSLTGSYLMASTTASGLVNQQTIWSPVSTSSANTVKTLSTGTVLDDWTNGYGLQITCGGTAITLGGDCSPVSIGSN